MLHDKIKSRIAETLALPVHKLGDERLIADVVTESFAIVEMVIDLQEEFGVRLEQDDLKALKTVGDLTGLIASRIKQ